MGNDVTGVSAIRRVALNGAASALGFVITVVGQLLLVPAFLGAWGAVRYGEWLVLTSVPAYFTMADFGIGQVGANRAGMLDPVMEAEEAKMVVHSIWAAQLVLGAIALLSGVTIFWLFDWKPLLGIEAASDRDVRLVLLGMLLYVLLSMQSQPYSAVYRVVRQNARYITITNGVRFVEILATFCVLWKDGNELGVVGVLLLSRVGALIVLQSDVRRQIVAVNVGLRKASLHCVKALWRPAIGHLGLGLAQSLQFQGINLILSRMLGGQAVAVYNVSRTLTRVPSQCVLLLNGAVYPEYGGIISSGSLAIAKKIHRAMLQAVLILATPFAIAILAIGPWLISKWTMGHVSTGRWLMIVLNSAVLINMIWTSSSVTLSSTNRHAALGVFYLVTTAAGLVVSVVATAQFGITGPAFVATCVEIAMLCYVLPRSCALVGDSVSGALMSCASPEIAIEARTRVREVFNRLK